MNRSDLINEYKEMIDGKPLFSGCVSMGIIEQVYRVEEYNVFDREYILRQLIQEWIRMHEDIIIPPNPNNAKYLVISLDHPDFHNFTDDKDQAIELRRANMQAGYATRIVDTETTTIVVD
jgi:cell division protein FtsX